MSLVLVTGPRFPRIGNVEADRIVRAALDKQLKRDGYVTVLEGGALGIDRFAKMWALDTMLRYHAALVTVRPKYDLYGNGAPFMRNQEMVDRGPNSALVFLQQCILPKCTRAQPHWTHGTGDCLSRIERAGIEHERIML